MVRTDLSGLCPSCGDGVPRSVRLHAGVLVETYLCPRDGARTYGPHGMPLREWAAPDMPTLRAELDIEAGF